MFESSATPSILTSSILILYVTVESVLLIIGSVKHVVHPCLTFIDTLLLLPYFTRFLSLTSLSLSLYYFTSLFILCFISKLKLASLICGVENLSLIFLILAYIGSMVWLGLKWSIWSEFEYEHDKLFKS